MDRRLSLLLISELFMAALVIATAILALVRLADERLYMNRYVFAPLLDIGEALIASDKLDRLIVRPAPDQVAAARGPILRLRGFLDRYQRDWETGPSNTPEAVRLRAELEQQGELSLVDQEHEAVGEMLAAVRSLERTTGMTGAAPADPPLQDSDVSATQSALIRLNMLNLRYVQIAYRAFERIHRLVTTLFFIVSLAGIAGAALFGLAVRQSIGPRVRRMVRSIERFRDHGEIEPLDDQAGDDLAVLAHTVALSLRSIADRNQERERFLAVAAHELKTPLTTLKGFAQVAIANANEPAARDRALSVIDRQATRLGRLVQDLLWSARAGAGQLPFHSAPLDFEALVRRVMGEIEMVVRSHAFDLEVRADAHVFGDAVLLEQSVWNMLIQAATMAPEGAPVRTSIDGTLTRVRLSVEVRSGPHAPTDLDDLIDPFAALQYEQRSGSIRSTGLGLHLVREIARLHEATLRVRRTPPDAIVFSLELPR